MPVPDYMGSRSRRSPGNDDNPPSYHAVMERSDLYEMDEDDSATATHKENGTPLHWILISKIILLFLIIPFFLFEGQHCILFMNYLPFGNVHSLILTLETPIVSVW